MNVLTLRHRLHPLGTLAVLGLFVAACTPATSAPPTARPPAPTAVIVLATLPPPPTAAPTPTATPFFDMNRIGGRWQLELTYRLHGYPGFDDIQYSTSVALMITSDGAISGSGALQTTLQQPPCSSLVRAGGNLAFAVTGSAFKEGEAIRGDLTLTPQDGNDTQTFERLCTDTTLNLKATVSILWSMLTTVNGLHFQIALQQAASQSTVRNLSGPSDGILHGTLATDIRLFR